jgi:hypothetical protein
MQPLAHKLGIRSGARSRFVKAPKDALKSIGTDDLDVASRLTGEFDYIHAFVTTASELDSELLKLKTHLKERGALWVSWPKNRQLNSTLVLTKIIEVGYDHGLVESKTLSVNGTWSAIKFTHPKKGKVYKNSYGKLPKEH